MLYINITMTFILSRKSKPKLVDNNILNQITKQNLLKKQLINVDSEKSTYQIFYDKCIEYLTKYFWIIFIIIVIIIILWCRYKWYKKSLKNNYNQKYKKRNQYINTMNIDQEQDQYQEQEQEQEQDQYQEQYQYQYQEQDQDQDIDIDVINQNQSINAMKQNMNQYQYQYQDKNTINQDQYKYQYKYQDQNINAIKRDQYLDQDIDQDIDQYQPINAIKEENIEDNEITNFDTQYTNKKDIKYNIKNNDVKAINLNTINNSFFDPVDNGNSNFSFI